jgi:hypothetical protein
MQGTFCLHSILISTRRPIVNNPVTEIRAEARWKIRCTRGDADPGTEPSSAARVDLAAAKRASHRRGFILTSALDYCVPELRQLICSSERLLEHCSRCARVVFYYGNLVFHHGWSTRDAPVINPKLHPVHQGGRHSVRKAPPGVRISLQ